MRSISRDDNNMMILFLVAPQHQVRSRTFSSWPHELLFAVQLGLCWVFSVRQ